MREEGGGLGTRERRRRLPVRKAFFEGVLRLNLRDTWRVPKEGPKGLVRRRVERGFRRNGFGLASGTGGSLRKRVRKGLRRKLRKEAFGKASGRFRKAYRSGFGDTCHLPKGLRRGLSVGFRKGFRKTLIAGFGING